MGRKSFKLIAGVVIGSGFLFANTSLIDQCFNGSKIACKELSQNRQTFTQLEEKCLNQKDEKACVGVGWILETTKNKKEIEKFHPQAEDACKKGNGGACFVLGGLYENSKDYHKAVELFKKACDLGSGWGCISLGGLYIEGAGVPANPTKAKELLKKACKLGVEKGCEFLKRIEEE